MSIGGPRGLNMISWLGNGNERKDGETLKRSARKQTYEH